MHERCEVWKCLPVWAPCMDGQAKYSATWRVLPVNFVEGGEILDYQCAIQRLRYTARYVLSTS